MTNRAGWMTWLMMTVGALTSVPATAADGSLASDASAVITTAPRRIIVSLADRRLVVVENNEVLAAFPVAVGAPTSPSPVGSFTVINRVTTPTYYRPGTVIAPGPRNPIGTRWIGLSRKGYGIHGTDEPSSIGYAKSHGCIRLRNADVEELFTQVRDGDVVELHAEQTPDIAPFFAPPHPRTIAPSHLRTAAPGVQ
jgi:lipoprotein-anchoring transpeptidase ErfK/SrfK